MFNNPNRLQTTDLSRQERVLAAGAVKRFGKAVLDFSVDKSGDRIYKTDLSKKDLEILTRQFRVNPKTPLAYIRQNLFAISQDERITEGSRRQRLSRYLDAYRDLTIKLDKATYGEKTTIKSGIPPYIPHGLIDMGSDWQIDPSRRGRDQIRVDKKEILNKYKPLLMHIFSADISKYSDTELKERIMRHLAVGVWRSMPYDHDYNKNSLGGVVELHSLDKGMCRHIALTYQVLAQACGLTSRLMKCTYNGGKHAANQVRTNNQWYIVDPTNPEIVSNGKSREFVPGVFKVNKPLAPGEKTTVQYPGTSSKVVYAARDNMYWRIDSVGI